MNKKTTKVKMDVASISSTKYLPTEPQDLAYAKWVTNQYKAGEYSDQIEFKAEGNNQTVCIMCLYIVKL